MKTKETRRHSRPGPGTANPALKSLLRTRLLPDYHPGMNSTEPVTLYRREAHGPQAGESRGGSRPGK